MDGVLHSIKTSTEGTDVEPTSVVCVDINGLALGAVPDDDARHAGAVRHIAQGVADLQSEEEVYEPAEDTNTEVEPPPLCLVQGDNSTVIMCEGPRGTVVATKLQSHSQYRR